MFDKIKEEEAKNVESEKKLNGPKNLQMCNGLTIPQIGFGVYQVKTDEEAEQCVLDAIKVGYRHIDTAHRYKNERGVGNALKKCGIPKNKYF